VRNGRERVRRTGTGPPAAADCIKADENLEILGSAIVVIGGDSSVPTAASCSPRSALYTSTGATSRTIIQVKSASANIVVYKIWLFLNCCG
jgi:hypothetical protein